MATLNKLQVIDLLARLIQDYVEPDDPYVGIGDYCANRAAREIVDRLMHDGVIATPVASPDVNPGRFNGQAFWSGAADTNTGKVLDVFTYETAEYADFHTDFYFPEELDGTFFCINNGELTGDGEPLAPALHAAIMQQITIEVPSNAIPNQ